MFLYRNEELHPKAAAEETFKIKDTLEFENANQELQPGLQLFYYLARIILYLIYLS